MPSKTARRDRAKDHHIVVARLGSGYAAVMMVTVEVLNDAGEVIGAYLDVQQTGIGRYETRAEAVKEAETWAEAEELELR